MTKLDIQIFCDMFEVEEFTIIDNKILIIKEK